MDRERWSRLQQVFDAALGLAAEFAVSACVMPVFNGLISAINRWSGPLPSSMPINRPLGSTSIPRDGES